jgi:ABC-type nitrate/sulfonate/bicarbonate transport system permease component
MDIAKWFKPFEKLKGRETTIIGLIWLAMLLGYWFISALGDTHTFPTPAMVWEGFKNLYSEGLVTHIVTSLGLFTMAAAISLVVSLVIAYLSPIPFLKPIAGFISKIRFLPLAGITYYLSVSVKNARNMQVTVLVVFMSLYFITSLLSVIKDVPEEEIDHARSLKCSRWEVLWEVIIKGRLDYVLDVLRQNLAIIWMMLVTVETILPGAGGLGVLITNSNRFGVQGRVVALQLVILVIGIALDWVLNKTRKAAFRYSTF